MTGLLFSSCSVVVPTLASPKIEVHIAAGQFARNLPITIQLNFPERITNKQLVKKVAAGLEPQIVVFDDAHLEIGEPFEILLEGTSADGCNRAWGEYSGSFDAHHTIVASDDIPVMQTLLGCIITTVVVIEQTSTPKPPSEYSIFLELAPKGLDPERPIVIEIWNPEQLAIREHQRECLAIQTLSTASSGEEIVQQTMECPEGIVYQEINPETHKFAVADIQDGGLTITSTSVQLGDTIMVAITATAEDTCNLIEGSIIITLTKVKTTIASQNFLFIQTLLGCPEPVAVP
jgi:hypothetical protein